ncbi:IclR family transcriptional regulator [Alsobacter soli]|uniref:IclR family transcriptional regulator n=1 Tax=Alsobacter soli TaxID=2109933 RepID=A0A2T1HVV2_9HYPH|nr:IclR family transcriptional regulator [Alsobacter soli]PSC05629.1 IclR family transcriptional regulator [Alsobacter soli]
MVTSVEKAFRVLSVFGKGHDTLSLSQVAQLSGMDVSSCQRFTHTLVKIGLLKKDPATKRFELTARTLDLGYNFLSGQRLVQLAMPYLLHLSKETEETVNLTQLDDTDIIFVSRFVSRHMLNTDVIVGTRMPAYCTAPGIALLSRLPEQEAIAILDRSNLAAHTPHTTWKRDDLIAKIRLAAKQGYATAFEEFYIGDASVAAAILDAKGRPQAAVNVAVSCMRYARDEIAPRFAPIVVATAHAMSQG